MDSINEPAEILFGNEYDFHYSQMLGINKWKNFLKQNIKL